MIPAMVPIPMSQLRHVSPVPPSSSRKRQIYRGDVAGVGDML